MSVQKTYNVKLNWNASVPKLPLFVGVIWLSQKWQQMLQKQKAEAESEVADVEDRFRMEEAGLEAGEKLLKLSESRLFISSSRAPHFKRRDTTEHKSVSHKLNLAINFLLTWQ